jgi:carboxylesterase type B
MLFCICSILRCSSQHCLILTSSSGAFTYGANSVARYRPQLLSLKAKQAGTPIVLVQIGYRLGSFGFAASSDIASELEGSHIPNGHSNGHQNGDVQSSLLGNYGLIDQRNAFEWVRDHISDFGGDPSNVTAFGISAGSASVHYHILAGEPLFDRAIMMSGAAPTLGPLPIERYERAWKELCDKSGVQGRTAAQRLEQLRALDPETLIENYSKAPLGPLADGKLLPTSWHLGQPQTPTRCKEVILGDTRVEAIIMDGLSLKIPQEHFHQLAHSAFASPDDADSFLTHFGFTTSPTLPYEAYRDAMRLFVSAAMFQFPNLGIAESYGPAGNAYLYHFEEPSPYAGPTFGLPYHGQCALFMYLNECETYPETARRTAAEVAVIWTAFAHGKRPWEPYSKAGRFMRFGPGGKSSVRDLRSDDVREYGYVEWLREHFEEVKLFAQSLTQE